jgi:predicted N-formylglutamate amidohydrolase
VYGVPGNTGLSDAARQARIGRFYAPFRDALASFIDQRIAAGSRPVIVTIHSFTPVFKGVRRDLDIGILHDTDARFADALLKVMQAETGFKVRRNAPYGPRDGVTHTLAEHAIPQRLLNAMIEIRHDLIGDPASQRAMAELLSRCVVKALATVAHTADGRGPLDSAPSSPSGGC